MENASLITVRSIQKIPECVKMPRQFVEYLRDISVVKGAKVPIVKREVWKYTRLEAGMIQSVWYFRQRGFDLKKSIELARKSQSRRDQKEKEETLFTEMAS